MAIVVVGGTARNVGKTSVVAGLIAATPQMRWTAFKVTPHWHGEPSTSNEPVDLTEETDPKAGTDSARFLAAGAVRSLWVRVRTGDLALAMPLIRKEMDRAENTIFESNSILGFLHPDLYLTVFGDAADNFKKSAELYLPSADAVLVPEHLLKVPAWEEISLRVARGTPVLPMRPPLYVTEEVKRFVRERLSR